MVPSTGRTILRQWAVAGGTNGPKATAIDWEEKQTAPGPEGTLQWHSKSRPLFASARESGNLCATHQNSGVFLNNQEEYAQWKAATGRTRGV